MKSYILTLVALITFGIIPAHSQQSRTSEFDVNGIKVIYKPSTKDIVSIRLFIKGGTGNYTKEQEGIESLALRLATEGGTKSKTKTEFASAMESIGTEIGSSSSMDYSEISMSCVRSFWDQSWSLFAEAITSPGFDAKEFVIVRGQSVAAARQDESDPDEHLKNQSLQNAFGNSNYSKIPTGTSSSLEKITLDQAKDHYSKILNKKNLFLVVVGNVPESDIKSKVLAAFGSLPDGSTIKPQPPVEFTADAIIENRDIATNYIRGVMNAPKSTDKDGVPMQLAMNILYDQYFVELRTKRSLSYAPGAYLSSAAIQNPYAIFYITTKDPKQSLQVMVDIINKAKNEGFTEKALKDMKESFLTNHYQKLETNETQSLSLGEAEIAGTWKTTETFMAAVDKATVRDLNDAFNKYSRSINWYYLGKESEVDKSDFKQPQVLPAAQKLTPKK